MKMASFLAFTVVYTLTHFLLLQTTNIVKLLAILSLTK